MCKDTTNRRTEQEKTFFSLEPLASGKKIKDVKVDFDAPDISSNGGLLLMGRKSKCFLRKLADLIPDRRNKDMIIHSYADMIGQRVGQILCGYEDANDCDRLRDDSALKMSVGRKPSDLPLASQPTITRLENNVEEGTLLKIGKLFVDKYVSSFNKPPKKVVLDVDDTNSNTYGAQQLTLFNKYYDEYCYMPMLIFDGNNGRLILPILRPGRPNKSVDMARLMCQLIEYLHSCWPTTVFELRGDSHFCSLDFMGWAHKKSYVQYTTGLAGNSILYHMVDEQKQQAKIDYAKAVSSGADKGIVLRRYYDLEYKARSWKYSQRVVAKIEVSSLGANIRFVVTKNRDNTPTTIYKRYCRRGEMELWIKDMKYFKADRMSCHSFKANQFRLFLYAAAYVIAHDMKSTIFKGTEIRSFTVDSLIKRVMLSAVHIVEKKTYIKISFSPHHRHRSEIELALWRLAG